MCGFPETPRRPSFLPATGFMWEGRRLLLDGTDVGFISTGVQTYRTLEAAKLLANEGVRAAVLHLPSVKPIDEEAVVRLAERTMRIVTTEDHSVIGGLGGAVSELLGERHPTLMRRVGIADEYSDSAPNDALLLRHGLDPLSIVTVARRFWVKNRLRRLKQRAQSSIGGRLLLCR